MLHQASDREVQASNRTDSRQKVSVFVRLTRNLGGDRSEAGLALAYVTVDILLSIRRAAIIRARLYTGNSQLLPSTGQTPTLR